MKVYRIQLVRYCLQFYISLRSLCARSSLPISLSQFLSHSNALPQYDYWLRESVCVCASRVLLYSRKLVNDGSKQTQIESYHKNTAHGHSTHGEITRCHAHLDTMYTIHTHTYRIYIIFNCKMLLLCIPQSQHFRQHTKKYALSLK